VVVPLPGRRFALSPPRTASGDGTPSEGASGGAARQVERVRQVDGDDSQRPGEGVPSTLAALEHYEVRSPTPDQKIEMLM